MSTLVKLAEALAALQEKRTALDVRIEVARRALMAEANKQQQPMEGAAAPPPPLKGQKLRDAWAARKAKYGPSGRPPKAPPTPPAPTSGILGRQEPLSTAEHIAAIEANDLLRDTFTRDAEALLKDLT